MSIFKMGGTTFHKYKKLKDMADKRAARHGEKIEVNDNGETRKHTHVKADEALEEAMELMEELLLERNKENRDKKEKWELKTNNITKKYKKSIQDYAKQEGDEAKFHREAAADYDHIYSQQPAQSPDGSPNSVAAYFNGKYQEMLRNKGRNEQNIADAVEPLTKKLKNRKHSFHDRVRGWTESEALEEALSLMEAIINEFNDDVKVKVGKIRADRALDSMKQLRNNSIALRKAQNSEEREKIANEMSKNSDELDVNYKKAKKFINLFNKNVKDNNKKQELKNYIESRGAADDKEYQEKIAGDSLKEALETWESAIKVLEGLFVKDGRGDLLEDVDTTLGSPVKRAVKGAAKQIVCPKKKEI